MKARSPSSSKRLPAGGVVRGRVLRFEGHAELRIGAPDHAAGAARAAVLESQLESLRHPEGIRELETSAAAGDVLHRAMNDRRAARHNDLGATQHPGSL